VVTPNLHEARVLSGMEITTLEEMQSAARIIHRLGPRYVVVKGGHLPQTQEAIDVLYDGHTFQAFRAPRIETRNTHGTGCTFASAIAAELAKGHTIVQAVQIAKAYLTAILQASANLTLGQGHGPMNHVATLADRLETA